MDWHRELERWLRAEQKGAHNVLEERLFKHPNYSCLVDEAWLSGMRLRMLAVNRLYAQSGAPWTPLPTQPVPFSPEAIVRHAMWSMGIPPRNVLFTDRNPDLNELRLSYGASIQHEIHAWVFTSEDGRFPVVYLNLASPVWSIDLQTTGGAMEKRPVPMWAVHLALCLYALYDRWTTHVGPGVPGRQVILPPFSEHEPDAVPIAHAFVKSLLLMAENCPPISGCRCNFVLEHMRRSPPHHRQMTGELPVVPAAANHMQFGRPARPTMPVTPADGITPYPQQVPPDWLEQLRRAEPGGSGEDDDDEELR